MPSGLILGARNLGGAIADHLAAEGWETAAVARSESTLAAVRERGHRAIAEQAFTFLHCGLAAMRGRGGTLIQVTGGSSRRAMPGRGLWAAGAFATRALVQSAAEELREEGIHAALPGDRWVP